MYVFHTRNVHVLKCPPELREIWSKVNTTGCRYLAGCYMADMFDCLRAITINQGTV